MPEWIPSWPPNWPEILSAVEDCIASGQWGQYHSNLCRELSLRLREHAGVSHCRLCCSGTSAIEIALRASGVKPGDEVILAAMDYPGNFRCIEALGARPVLVDVQRDSPCIDLESVQRVAQDSKANGQIVAMIASSLYGHAADYSSLQKLCLDQGWTLINDACQVIGMKIDDSPVESFGQIATLSFGGSKVVTAGCGGAILTSDDRIASRIGSWMDRPSESFPISPLQAAVIGPQLDRLDAMHAKRNENTAFWCQKMEAIVESTLVPRPNCNPKVQPAYYKLAFESASVEARDLILERATEIGLPMGPAFRSMDRSSPKRCRKPVSLENSRRISDLWVVLDQRALLSKP